MSNEQLLNLLFNRPKRQGIQAADRKHDFWDTQPVPKISQELVESGPLQHQTVDDIQKEPYKIPAGFEWSTIDIHNDAEADEMYQLLTHNYVEDDEAFFRFDYSVPFLRWALTVPDYRPELHLGVRSIKTGKLFGCITGVPATMRIHNDEVRMIEINFLCVHKKLRSKRLAPMLIKEVTRRVNLGGVFQAVYTAGVVLPKPVAQAQYWHRSLNPKKLVEVGFSRIGERMTLARTIRLYKLPEAPTLPGIRAMEPRDCESACDLLNTYLARFKFSPTMSLEEFSHHLLPRTGVVNSYVITDGAGKVTDLCSFYHLPSSVMKSEKHKTLYAAYSFYNVATTVDLSTLMTDLLIFAKSENMDVFNALDVMENTSFMKKLKFGPGDGNLQYYLYNWGCPQVDSENVGLVLL